MSTTQNNPDLLDTLSRLETLLREQARCMAADRRKYIKDLRVKGITTEELPGLVLGETSCRKYANVLQTILGS